MMKWLTRHRKGIITSLLALFLIIGMGIRCRDYVICRVAEYYLRSSEALPSDLTVQWNTSSMNFRELHCSGLTVTSVSDPQFSIVADECVIAFFTHSKGLYFSPHITLHALNIVLPQTVSRGKKKQLTPRQIRSLYSIGSLITVESGKLYIDEKTFFPFTFGQHEEEQSLIIYHLHQKTRPLFACSLSQIGRTLEVKAHCNELDIQTFPSLPFLSHRDIFLKQGVFDGKFKGILTNKNKFDKVSYGFSARKFCVNVAHFEIGGSELLSYRSIENPGNSFFDAEWQLTDCYINRKEHSGKITHLIKDVRANIPSRSGDVLTVKGALHHWGGFHPFVIQGVRNISQHETKLEVKLSSEPFVLTYDMEYTKEGSGTIKCDFSECDVFLIESFVKETIAKYFPQHIEIPTIHQGLVSGSAYARLFEWKLDTIEVEQLGIEKFSLEWENIPGKIIGDELQCFFRYAAGVFPSWGIHLQNISIPAANVTKCTGDFAIHERYVIPSTLQGNVENTFVKATVRGVLPTIKLSVETGGGCVPLFNTLFPHHTLTSDELSTLLSLSMRSMIQIHEHSLNIRGFFSAFSLAYSDTIDFQCNIAKPETITRKGIQEAIQEITFAGKNTSSLFLNLPLGIAGQPWRLRGKTSFEGRITQKELQLTCKQPAVSFISPVLKVDIKNVQRDATLTYQFVEDRWKGVVPVSDATLYLPRTELQFSKASGDVIIDGKEVYIKKVSATYDDLHVDGRMVVHFPEGDDVNIELITTQLFGKVETLQNLLIHFDDFKDVSFPIVGTVTQEEGKGLRLKTTLSDNGTILHWGADLRIIDGIYSLSEHTHAEEMSLDIEWDGATGDIAVSNLCGIIQSPQTNETLAFKESKCTIKNDVLDSFALLVDNGTYDVLALYGDVEKKGSIFHVHFEPDRSHIYSIPLDTARLSFSKEYQLQECEIETKVSVQQIKRIAMLANLFGYIPVSQELSSLLTLYSIRCDPTIQIEYNREKNELHLVARAEETYFNGKQYEPWSFIFAKSDSKITQCDFGFPSFSFSSKGRWAENKITLDTLEMKRNKAYAKLSALTFDYEEKKIHCVLDKVYTKLEELKKEFPAIPTEYQEYFTGALTCTGELTIDLSQGYKKPIFLGLVDIIAPKIGKGNLQLVSHHPISFHIDLDTGITCENIELLFSTLENEKHWAQIECTRFTGDFFTNDYKVDGMRALIPPEMFLFIARTESIPFIYAGDKSLKWYGVEIPWENQVDISASVTYSQGVLTCTGGVKDGYYWVGNTSLFIHDVMFSLGKDTAQFSANMDVYKQPVSIMLEAAFSPSLNARLTLEDKRAPEARLHDSHTTLSVLFAEDSFGKVNIKSIQGGIYGIDIAFQQQSHQTTESELVLSGKLRCHMPFLATILPSEWQELIDTLGMGKGYEISGDLTLNWEDLHSSTFAGYIKGKNFELLSARIQTLMGTLRISKKEVSIDRFIISDEAGQLTINEIQCIKGDDDTWRLSIPQITLQDFRPSLLRYIGKYRGKMKPLVVRELLFHDITGEIGDLNSFSGHGDLAFTNTFKKEYNLLDIPFELIARLGIDMGLLVPIRGKLAYEIKEGKIFFTELSESCSEGKRSKFYLSKTSPSYISLTGEINVSIKMKQYVILKVTEPFILSITGSLKKPKYSLR